VKIDFVWTPANLSRALPSMTMLDSGVIVNEINEFLKKEEEEEEQIEEHEVEVEEEEEEDISESENDEEVEPEILDTKTRTLSTHKGELYLTTYIKDDKKMIRIETDKSITIPLSMLSSYVIRNDLDTIEKIFVDKEDFLCITSTFVFIFAVAIAGMSIWILSISEKISATHPFN